MRVKNIQVRLLIWLLPLFFIVLAVLSSISYVLSKQALEKSVDETAMAIGTDYANRVQSDMELMTARLEDLADNPVIRSASNKEQIISALAQTQNRLNSFDAMIFILPDGSGVNSSGASSHYGDRDYFKKVMATKKPIISDPLTSKTTGKLSVVLAVPVLDHGQLTGVLVGTVSMDRLTSMMKELKFLETGYGQLSDDSGIIIAHPKRPELVGKLNLREKQINPELQLPKNELDERLINLFKASADLGLQSRTVYTFVDGVSRVAVGTPISLPGGQRWVMMVAAPEAEATQAISHLSRLMLLISVGCLVLACMAILILAKKFAKPITIMRDECLLLAQGDLQKRELSVTSEDEIGQLASGFQEMGATLRTLIGQVHTQSEQLAASSEQLTASADQSALAANQVAASITDVANGAIEQLTAATETSAIVEQMSASIEQVSATTNAVAEQSIRAASKAHEGSSNVNKAVEQMIQIEQTVNHSAQVVADLGQRSKEIGQIVETISGIAGQTNLLALNAAIEAARAGEQGRGFAVVAEEVRKLAEQSQAAAKQIAELIGGIQADTESAVQAMDHGTREVKLGADVVNSAGQAFDEIVTVVSQVSDQVREIAAEIDQMAVGSQQIVSAVNLIDGLSKKASGEAQTVSAATQEQSASMEEIAAASKSLAILAMNLQEAVNKFRI